MPALHFLRRKWLIACDDFVIPGFLDTLIRFSLCAYAIIKNLFPLSCDKSQIYIYSIYGLGGYLFLTSCLSLCVVLTSARGSVLEVEKRRFLSKILYARLFFLFCDIGVALYGMWHILKEEICLDRVFFVKFTTVFAWIYVMIIFGGIMICFDSLGSTNYWNVEANSNALNFFKKAQYIWKMRLKLFCCCADPSSENDLIYVEVSTFMASFLNGIDLVPTDILAGIITLSQKHVLERKKHMLVHLPQSIQLLEETPVSDWMAPENALYFLRIAKSTYGWMVFYKTLRPWKLCVLAPHARCCTNRPPIGDIHDNCLHLNYSAIRKLSGFHPSDILHMSFSHNGTHEPAFYVAVSHPRKTLVVAVRGTMSFSDLMTDIDAGHQDFPNMGFRCHRGALLSAMFVQKRLQETGVLQNFFAENPTYTLALTGHSLGGSVAALLSLLLRPTYPNLQCYAFGPLAAISAPGIQIMLPGVMSVVVGEDMAPRLSAKSCIEMREQLMESLRECRQPKFKILIEAFWYHTRMLLKVQPSKRTQEVHENNMCVVEEVNANQPSKPVSSEDRRLYAPGRILYFERNNWSNPYWLTGLNLQSIIVNPDMISDHQPHKIQDVLETYLTPREEVSHL
ncbi:hypothetical protein JTE90_008818 [Oedothorax gibbosus]|uniref:sn-1-specific diacylglycerol lipase n=1 Tax=Oedothorax gibbosus TaxID=931172 RepID=A0AAV6V4U7_9ARAC|nr:hypothetical protein JTE90_008818 [Oedothorax gibbosus]